MNNSPRFLRLRILADIILFFSILCAPWWIMALIVFGGAFFFKNFYEAFFAGFLFDALYGTNVASVYGFRFFFSTAFLFLIFVADFVKGKVRV